MLLKMYVKYCRYFSCVDLATGSHTGSESFCFILQWSIKIHNGSNEALTQYKINITSIAPLLEKLAKSSDVYWILQGKVMNNK